MILLLDTSTPICKVILAQGGLQTVRKWQADRELARGLLGYLLTLLSDNGFNWQDITGLGVFRGPGSFTGLRIGITVLNTVSDSMNIPIVGQTGDDWVSNALDRLDAGENDRVILPEYGSQPRITLPRK